MRDGAAIALIVVGAVAVVVTSFWLRKVLPGPAVFVLLSAFSVVLTAGALAVQERTTAADWTVALVAMAFLGPLHVRVLLGPFGRRANAVRRAPSAA